MIDDFSKFQDGWSRPSLGTVLNLTIIMGQSPPSSSYNPQGDGLPFYQGKKEFGADFPTPSVFCTEPKKIAEKGDILLSVRAPVGPTNHCAEISCIGRGLAAIRADKSVLDVRFLRYFFLNFEKHIAGKGQGSTFSAISKKDISELKIPLPPLNEQKRIVTKLDALFTRIDTAISHLQETLELSKALFASALDEVFSGNNEQWKVIPLNKVATVGRGKSKHRPRNDKSLFGGDYPFIQTGDVRNAEKYIITHSVTYNDKGLAQSKLWPKGTICLTIAANIGEVAVLGIDACFPDSVVGISSGSESNDYIYYFLTTLQRHLDSKATMAAQKNINLRVLSEIKMPLPTLEEQQRIVAHLDALADRTRTLEAATQEKLDDLSALKASLLDAAFKGQL